MADQSTKSTLRRHHRPSRLPQVLILGGVVLLAVMVLVIKQTTSSPDASSAISTDSPEVQLDRALQAGQPTLAFFHSNNCQQCIEMIQVVGDVYPEFDNSVGLVDIDVYDSQNSALLQRVGLQFIPTLIFYDHEGNAQVSVGVIEADQLRQILAALAEGG